MGATRVRDRSELEDEVDGQSRLSPFLYRRCGKADESQPIVIEK
jgi:hypothetical protein